MKLTDDILFPEANNSTGTCLRTFGVRKHGNSITHNPINRLAGSSSSTTTKHKAQGPLEQLLENFKGIHYLFVKICIFMF